jgi:lipopolysaccharide biosynthesis protein
MFDSTFGGYKIIGAENHDKNNDIEASTINAAVLIHLYYTDTIPVYFKYIVNIPASFTKIFTFSDDETLEVIKQELIKNHCSSNCIFIKKENRGRDISALLVAARKELLNYDLICFIHDKKSHSELYTKDTENWISTLWTNTIGSKEYIEGIVNLFKKDKDIGVLFPPYPFEGTINYGAYDGWGDKNYNHTVALAEKLNLKIRILKAANPCSVGTMFWARTGALRKLLGYPWDYTDFDKEPMSKDGTISHAVERIIRFVSMDAGYKEYFCLSENYAEQYLMKLHSYIRAQNSILEKCVYVSSRDVNYYEKWMDNVEKHIRSYQYVFLYGAGHFGVQCQEGMKRFKRKPEAFLISPSQECPKEVNGLPVYIFDASFKIPDASCIIVTMEKDIGIQVLQYIQSLLGYEKMKDVFLYQTE